MNGISSGSELSDDVASSTLLLSFIASPQKNGCSGQASGAENRSKLGISRIGAYQAESNQRQRQEDAKKEQGPVSETLAGCHFNTFYYPVGGQIQNGGNESEIDELHDFSRASVAQFPDAVIVRYQENVS